MLDRSRRKCTACGLALRVDRPLTGMRVIIAIVTRLSLRHMFLFTAVVALAASWFLWRPLLGDEPFGPSHPPPPPVPANVAPLYDAPVPALHFSNTPLGSAIDQLRQASGVSIFVNWRALQAAAVNKDTLVNGDIPACRFADSLKTLLTRFGTYKELDFDGDAQVVTLSTRDDFAGRNLSTRVIDIRHLIVDAPAAGLPVSYSYSWPPTYGRPAVRRRHVWTPLDRFTHFDRRTSQERTDALVKFIEQSVDRTSWRDQGGQLGAIRDIKGQLIITQTAENHVEIAYLLNREQWKMGLRTFALHTGALLFLSLLLVKLISIPVRRKRRRSTIGLCLRCGYDLRATPGRCPECGAKVQSMR